MYQIVKNIFYLIRNEVLPNPFGFISTNPNIVEGFTFFIGEPILFLISFWMCKILYDREEPIIGSILYMFFYSTNIFILINLNKLCTSINKIVAIYIVLVILIFIGLIQTRMRINKKKFLGYY
ncbi:MAG: hypothetical protein E7311_05125 [Clostridiales bacterium]|nr:hypothetical protein [Clostridiales bacterium]